ncbi:MAG: hypothetical protein ABIM89_00335, partial [Mycobacteriales bacterium]
MATKGQNRATAAPLLVILAITAMLYGVIALNGWGFTPKLGLDLQGGTSVILTPKTTTGAAVTTSSVQKAVDIIRQRINGSGVSEAEVTREDKNILVSIPGADKRQLEQVDKTAQLRFRLVLNTASGSAQPAPAASASPDASASPGASASPSASASSSATASAPPSASASVSTAPTSPAASSASPTANGRALTGGLVGQASGSPSASATSAAPSSSAAPSASASASSASTAPSASVDPNAANAGADPNALDPQAASIPGIAEALTAYATLDCNSDDPAKVAEKQKAADSDADATKAIATCSDDGAEKMLLGPAEGKAGDTGVGMTGTDVKTATATIPDTTWLVNLELTGGGKKKFSALTSANVNKRFAIVLDGLIVSAPTINEAITGGSAQISGSFNKKSANDLANVLKYGALPLSFTRSSTDQISPTLGKKSLH